MSLAPKSEAARVAQRRAHELQIALERVRNLIVIPGPPDSDWTDFEENALFIIDTALKFNHE